MTDFAESMKDAKANCKRQRSTKQKTIPQLLKENEAVEIARRNLKFEEVEWITARLKNDLCESDEEAKGDRLRLTELCLELGIRIPTELVVDRTIRVMKPSNNFEKVDRFSGFDFRLKKLGYDFVIGQGVLRRGI